MWRRPGRLNAVSSDHRPTGFKWPMTRSEAESRPSLNSPSVIVLMSGGRIREYVKACGAESRDSGTANSHRSSANGQEY